MAGTAQQHILRRQPQQLSKLYRLAQAAGACHTLHSDCHLAVFDRDQVLRGLASEGLDDDLDFAAWHDNGFALNHHPILVRHPENLVIRRSPGY